MQIQTIQDITSQKGYKVNNQFFVPYEGNSQYDRDNKDLLQILDWIKDGGIVEPEYTAEQLLERTKQSKLAQLKTNLIKAKEGETPRKGSLESYQIDGVFRTFKVKLSDLPTVVARVSRLEKAAVGTTAQWTDVDGNRLDLNLQQFESLMNHLDVRDQTLHMLYEEIKTQIKTCTILEDLEQIDINFV